jgi:hypothetical protein
MNNALSVGSQQQLNKTINHSFSRSQTLLKLEAMGGGTVPKFVELLEQRRGESLKPLVDFAQGSDSLV